MRHSGIFFTLAIALLTVALWAILNRPTHEPPWPERINGFSFAPMRHGDDPQDKEFPSVAEIDEDLALLQGDVDAIRTYSVEDSLALIPHLATAHGIETTLGVWIGTDEAANERELERLERILTVVPHNIRAIMLGNEVLLRRDQSRDRLVTYMERVRRWTSLPVSTAEPWHIWLKYPDLAEHVDFITVHLLPYWEGIPLDKAVSYAFRRLGEVRAAYPHKRVIVGEVGWPSNGRRIHGAEASVANQSRFLRRFIDQAETMDLDYFVMEAFDQPWKADVEGAIGAYWGVYDVGREPKFTFTRPVVRIPRWHELAALSVALAILMLTVAYRDSASMGARGMGFLALVSYAISTASVWIVYDYTRQYMTLATVLVGVLLLVAGVGVVVLLVAEAHEWAEALWLRGWRRNFPQYASSEAKLPLVSIHVAAYNEPPALLIETLNALAALDYPRFEVLVIDNNTDDPALWEPVRAHCEHLGECFHFFHVAPLAGFKAGALNFALRHTDPDAAVVAVIDADYVVDPCWLRELLPAFSEPKIALVQGPQDYRDGGETAFKAMCLAEYRGFFHIGMVTRNERNAIIQHGTMTLIRRSVMDDLDGWAEWCITEDAELGLRLFEQGQQAMYVPVSYGRGLMPDTFVDFKKQRHRWAYGAVRILRHHRRELLGLRTTSLTPGQRYHFLAGWLPWLADGINLLVSLTALGWSVAMVLAPNDVMPPVIVLSVLPLALFVFKLTKTLYLYRRRVSATLLQSLAAGLTGLALSHTVGKAVWAGVTDGSLGFFRTPKFGVTSPVWRALTAIREEWLLLVAFVLALIGVMQRDDAQMYDVRIWCLVLTVQGLPYLATLVLSLISVAPRLPAGWIGPLPEMGADAKPGRVYPNESKG